MKQNKNKSKNEKYNKSLSDVFKNYNQKKWVAPKSNNLSFIFIWSIIGLLKPHNKSNNNNQNGGFNNWKNY